MGGDSSQIPQARKRSVEAMIADRPDAKLDPVYIEEQVAQYALLLKTPNTVGKPVGWQSDKDWSATVQILQQAGILESKFKGSGYVHKSVVRIVDPAVG